MVITKPTIDDFFDNTVMRVIRNIVKWIQTDLVPQINANDIVSATQTSDGLSFEINLIKGDGSQIPVGKITLGDEDNIASGSFHFDDETRMLSGTLLKEDGTPINIPAVEIPGGSGTQIDYGIQTIKFTYQDNNLNCVITQKDGTQTTSNTVVIAGGGGTGGNPYPTAITGSVGADGNITLNITMSEGQPLTATINMATFATVEDLEDIQTQISGLKLSSSGNNMTLNGDSVSIINSVEVELDSSNNLKIIVNGIESDSISIPIAKKKLVTSGDISQFISYTKGNNYFEVIKEFDIEYLGGDNGNHGNEFILQRQTVSKGVYTITSQFQPYAFAYSGFDNITYGYIQIGRSESTTGIEVYCKIGGNTSGGGLASPYYQEDITITTKKTSYYRMYA